MKLFVYGTLKPGHERYPVLSPFVEDKVDAEAPGELYNIGNHFPAARFDDYFNSSRIPGVLLFVGDKAYDHVIATLDAIEGHPNLFLRRHVEVLTMKGDVHTAISYEFVNAEYLDDEARIVSWHPERDE